ncbi:hypothetical protein [Azohydromonas aeria]|uniref:hypothetical protein n=1 Tax=Azohydromonas aeria TaxID=2590212 RepID=UPI0012FAE89C|nr:hypothetical protein [Azohydromonas aeria]
MTAFTLTSASTQAAAPFVLGQVFKRGSVPAGSTVVVSGADAQVTPKAYWSDGSLRFAVVAGTANVSTTAATLTLSLGTAATGAVLTTAELRATGAAVTIDCGVLGAASWAGTDWDAPLDWSQGGPDVAWVSGHRMSSWIYRKPVGSDAHLVAWLEVRLFATGQVEILPWIENGYVHVAAPTNKSATYTVTIGSTQRFSQAIDLPHHCRTPLIGASSPRGGAELSYWLGADPRVTPQHDLAYFQATEMVPTYWPTVPPSQDIVASLPATYTPLQQGNYPTGMGAAGYSPSIGLIPEWDVLYLTCPGSAKPYEALIRNAYSAGRYGMHYRDETTQRPIRFSAHPGLCLNATNSGVSSAGHSTLNDYTPQPGGATPATWASSHHPSVGYMAYLVTGRFYHLEQLQFAATLNYLKQIDATRQFAKGLFLSQAGANTTRGSGWAMRTLCQAASVTPAEDPLHAEFIASTQHNVDYLHGRYVAQPSNPQGWVQPYSDYTGATGSVAAGSTATLIQMPAGFALAQSPVGWTLTTGGNSRTVIAYDNVAKTLLVDSPFPSAPAAGSSYSLNDSKYFEAAWMQDYVTASWGYGLTLDLPINNQAKFAACFEWKAQSIVGRLGGTDPTEFLYRDAAQFTISIAPANAPNYDTGEGPWYANWGECYADTLGEPNPGEVGNLRGDGSAVPTLPTGYWTWLQPGIVYAMRHGVAGAAEGYARMTGAANWPALRDLGYTAPVWYVKQPEAAAAPVASTSVAALLSAAVLAAHSLASLPISAAVASSANVTTAVLSAAALVTHSSSVALSAQIRVLQQTESPARHAPLRVEGAAMHAVLRGALVSFTQTMAVGLSASIAEGSYVPAPSGCGFSPKHRPTWRPRR